MFKYCALFGLFLQTTAQITSDAYVKITSDQGQLAGALGIYEFTVEVLSGFTIQTYLPSQLINDDGVSMCLQRTFNVYTQLTSCSYDSTLNMVQFTIPNTIQTGGWIFYDIGYFVNPQVSMLLTGFLIQIFDQYGNLVSQSDPAALFVQILPNILTMQSLTVSSDQIAAQSTFLFSFSTTNPVPAQGQIQVTFPSTQIAVPTVGPQTQVSVDYGNTWKSVTTAQITQSALFFVIPISFGSNVAVQLRILQLNNPNTMAVTQSFMLATLNEELSVIDQVSSGLTVQCTIPAQLNITQVTISARTVGATTSATFRLSLPIRYSVGGYIIVTTPSSVSYNSSSIQCILLVGFVNDLGFCTILSPTKLKLFGAINQQQLTFSVAGGLVNPSNTQPTNNFLIQAFDPDGNLIANSAATPSFGYTPTPGTIQAATVTRSNNTVGQTTNVTISFRNQNILQTDQIIQVQIPITQFLTSSESILCYQKTSSDSTFNTVDCLQSLSPSNLTLSYGVFCGSSSLGYCQAGTQLSLLVSGLKNPGQVSTPTQSVQISSMTSDQLYLIDQIRNGVFSQPALLAGQLANMSLTKSVGYVGSTTSLQIQTTIMNVVPSDGSLVLTIQDQSFQAPTNGLLSCVTPIFNLVCAYSSYTSGYIKTITISQLCGASDICTSSTQLNVNITELRNPKSTYPIQNLFTLQTQTSLQQQIDFGSFQTATGLQIQPASLQFVRLASPQTTAVITTGAKQTYQVQVGVVNGIEPILGSLVLSLPIEISLTNSTCSAISQTTSQTLACSISQNNATVTHSFTSTNFAGQTILISFNNAVNPTTTEPSSFASVVSYLKQSAQDQTLYLVESLSNAFQVAANTANLLGKVAIQRTVTLVDTQTTLQLCMTMFNPLPANGVALVLFPTDQVILGSSIQSNITLTAIEGQQLTLQWSQGVTSNTQTCISLYGDIKNSASTKVSSTSVQIKTYTSTGFAIDQQTSGIFLTPYLSAGPFGYIAVKYTNSTVGQTTNLIVDLQAQAFLTSGTLLQIAFPSSTFYFTSFIQCTLQGFTNECQNITLQSDSIGQYVTSVFVVLGTSFSPGMNFTLTVGNLLNKFDTSPLLLTNINVIAQDNQGNGISQSIFLLNLTYTPNTAGTLNFTRSQLIVQMPTVLTLQVNLQTRLPQNALIQILISQSLVGSVSNPSLTVNGQTITPLLTNNDGFYVLSLQIPAQPDLKQLQVVIGGFTNSHSTGQSSGGISVQTRINSYKVDQIQLQNPSDSLVPTSVTISGLSLSNPIVGQTTQLTLTFNLTGSARKDDIVSITCQTQFVYLQTALKVYLQETELQSSSTKDSASYLTGFSFVLPQSVSDIFSVTLNGLANIDSDRPLDFRLLASVDSSLGGTIAQGGVVLEGQDILVPAKLTSTSFIRSTALPLNICSIEFKVTLPQLSNISPSTVLQVLIPSSELLIDQTNQCVLNGPQTCIITAYNNSYIAIQILGLCSLGCESNQTLQISLQSGFQNPGSQVLTQLPYQIVLLDGQFTVAQLSGGVSLLPILQMNISLGEISLSTTSQTVGLYTDLHIQIVIVTAFPAGSSLLVTLPNGAFYLSDTLTCEIQTQTQSCQNVETHYDLFGQFYTSLQVTTISDVHLGQTLDIVIKSIRNKFSTAPLASAIVTVSVQSVFGSAVCQSQQTLNTNYLTNTLATISAIRTQKTVQSATTFDLTTNIYNRLKAGSIMSVSISKNLIGSTSVVSVVVDGSPKVSNLTTSSQYYTSSFQVPAYDDLASISIQISGLTNRYSAEDVIGGVQFQTSIDGYLIDSSFLTPISDSLSPIAASVQSFNVSNTVVGQKTSLASRVLITGFAKQNDVVQIQSLQQNFYLGQDSSLFYGDVQIQASFNQDQLGFFQGVVFVLPSDLITSTSISIFGLQNNDRTAPIVFQFQVTIVSSNGGLIAQGTSEPSTQKILTPALISVSQIVRNSSSPGQPCSISMNLTTPQVNKISPNVKLMVMIPVTELSQTVNGVCLDSFGIECLIYSSTNASYTQLVLSNVCQNGCAAGQVITVQVKSGFSNPATSKASSVPYQVQLTDQEYLVAQVVGGIVLTPSLQQNVTMVALNIFQNELISGSFTQVSFTFRVNSDVSGATNLQIQIPPNTLIKDAQAQQSCTLGGVTIICSLAETQLETGAPIFVTKIQMAGIQGRITPNTSLTVTIKNLRNSDIPRNRSPNFLFGLALVDQSTFVYANAFFSEQILGNLTVASINNFSVTRNKVRPSQTLVSYTFTFMSQNYIRVNQMILLQIPKEQADVAGGIIRCNEPSTGFTVQCQELQSNDGLQLLQVNQWCTQTLKTTLCPPNTPLSVTVVLTNPSSFASSLPPIFISSLTSNSVITAQSTAGAIVTPQLTGIMLGPVALQRQKNVLGTRETLLISIESIGASLFSETNLLLDLPDGVAYQFQQSLLNCTLNNQTQVTCNVTQTHSSTAIAQIVVNNVCTQSRICQIGKSLNLSIGNIKNPSTNNIPSSVLPIVSLTQGKTQIARSNVSFAIIRMAPASIFIITQIGESCQTFGTCPITISLQLTNPLQKFDYLTLQSPLNFKTTLCQIVSGQSLSCIIDNKQQLRILATAFVNSTLPIKVVVAAIDMPQSTQSVTNFLATSFETVNGTASTKDRSTGGNVTVNPSAFKSLTITRTSSSLSASVNISISFATNNSTQITPTLGINMPIQQAIFQSNTLCMSRNRNLPCTIVNQQIQISGIADVCINLANVCQIQVLNALNPQSVYTGANSQQVDVQLLAGNQHKMVQQSATVSPVLTPSEFKILSATTMPSNAPTASEIKLIFSFALNQNGGQYMQISFSQWGFVPIYSQLSPLIVKINDQVASVVDFNLKYTGFYWAPVDYITFLLPPSPQNQLFTATVTGIHNPFFWNSSFDQANLVLAYLQSSLATIAKANYPFDVSMTPDTIDPVTVYSESPFVSTKTYLRLSFGLRSTVAYSGKIQISLPNAFLVDRNLNCSSLETQEKVVCQLTTANLIELPFSSVQSYTGFSLRIGPITNPALPQKSNFTVTVKESDGIYAQGQATIQAQTQGSDCNEGCSQCMSTGECVSCDDGLVLSSGRCQSVCAAGEFSIANNCYACQNACLACQTQNECSLCPTNKFLVSGLCLDQCPLGYQTLSNFTCSIIPSTATVVDCSSPAWQTYKQTTINDTGVQSQQYALQEAGLNSTSNPSLYCKPVFPPVQCQVQNCSQCGLIDTYCEQCSQFRLDGVCLSSCPIGYFGYQRECFKCNPACKSCQGSANSCTTCSNGLLFSQQFASCTEKCPTGTYYTNNFKTCTSCDKKCTTCAQDAGICTSCTRDPSNGEDLYLSDGACVQKCKKSETADLRSHKCKNSTSSKNPLIWTIPLCVVALLVSFAGPALSKVLKGGRSTASIAASAGLVCMFDFVNKLGLLMALWSSEYLGVFVITGMTLLAVSMLGIYEAQLVRITDRPPILKVISQLVGPHSTRLYLSNFLAIFKAELTSTQEPQSTARQYEICCIAQSALSLIQIFNCTGVLVVSSLQSIQFGLALNGLVFGSVGLALHATILRNARASVVMAK